MQGTAAVTLSNENGLSAPGHLHTCSPADVAYGAVHGHQPGRSVHPGPCPPTNQRY